MQATRRQEAKPDVASDGWWRVGKPDRLRCCGAVMIAWGRGAGLGCEDGAGSGWGSCGFSRVACFAVAKVDAGRYPFARPLWPLSPVV